MCGDNSTWESVGRSSTIERTKLKFPETDIRMLGVQIPLPAPSKPLKIIKINYSLIFS